MLKWFTEHTQMPPKPAFALTVVEWYVKKKKKKKFMKPEKDFGMLRTQFLPLHI